MLASFLVLSGPTADRIGRKRTFQAGLVLFTLGSLLCSLVPGLSWLVVFRMVQAVGGSMLNPVAIVLLAGAATSGRWARATAERTASRLMPPSARVTARAP